MPDAVDLRGIHFRAYLPQFDEDIEDGDYDPVGPGDASITNGAIDLSAIAWRDWEENGLGLDDDNVGGDTGEGNDGTNDSSIGSLQPDGLIWPFDEILNV